MPNLGVRIPLKRLNIKLIVCILLLAVCFPVNATVLKKLFEVGVPVMSQSGKERKEASKKAFEILLVRITGRRDLVQTEIGQVLIENARLYVSSFRYELIKEEVFESVDFMPARSVDDEEEPEQAFIQRRPSLVNGEFEEEPEATEEPPIEAEIVETEEDLPETVPEKTIKKAEEFSS